MALGNFQVPVPANEPVNDYAPGTPERASLEKRLASMSSEQVEIPLIIGGEEVRTGSTRDLVMPHDHGHVLGRFHQAGPEEVKRAIDAAEAARADWASAPWEDRAAVFLRAAEMLAGPRRDTVNAATMLGQSKTPHQAEIDSACELIDFYRFNVSYMTRIYDEQPRSLDGAWNRMEHRPLDGFVFAITPFNFTAIAGNLPTSPAMMGNTTLWKPASTAVLSNYYVMRTLIDAGLPPGVVNFLPGSGATVGDPVIADGRLGGVHFTGSTAVFEGIWRTIGENIRRYGQYPRLVGETGGKDFIFAHPSAEVDALAVAIVRGAFEYQGQKCSAVSRTYVPKSLWPRVRDAIGDMLGEIRMGDVRDFSNFLGAVIDQSSFTKLKGVIESAREDSSCRIVFGGECDDSKGWFVSPTVIETTDPKHDLMGVEYFGPIVAVYVYEDGDFDETLELCDAASPYALTGGIFARDRDAIRKGLEVLRFTAGNFYINDKPTGAVVSQQPFGGSRASGTNDKAGSILNLIRWVSPRSIKETFVPATDYRYPYLG